MVVVAAATAFVFLRALARMRCCALLLFLATWPEALCLILLLLLFAAAVVVVAAAALAAALCGGGLSTIDVSITLVSYRKIETYHRMPPK